ncbi:RluA family pseudouridine synthase [Frankia sp. R82]|uniref:RluA family pseudouridine synthase n=1 Tax=Frankia sp. R82 TaxID=2950553 RepID=UPI002043DC49|nr:RNA pseudouridine synthase [Frankia sp. R82]MCM3887314.1 RNA pseudouridine synthase [Frankia sp. R82]
MTNAQPSWAALRTERLVYVDDEVLALDKPAGISVTGERHDTDLVRLAAAQGERLFPVHRIDKATSGLILFARELRFHGDLTRQFARRTVGKCYLALTRTRGLPAAGIIDLPLSVGRKNRVRIAANRADIRIEPPVPAGGAARWTVRPGAVFDHVRVYPSVTTFSRVWEGGDFTLLAAVPVSGRRHQIRVHLAWIGHPIDGDPLFDRSVAGRALLHSWRLAIDVGGQRRRLEAPPGADFWAPGAGHFPPALAAGLPDLVPWVEGPSLDARPDPSAGGPVTAR